MTILVNGAQLAQPPSEQQIAQGSSGRGGLKSHHTGHLIGHAGRDTDKVWTGTDVPETSFRLPECAAAHVPDRVIEPSTQFYPSPPHSEQRVATLFLVEEVFRGPPLFHSLFASAPSTVDIRRVRPQLFSYYPSAPFRSLLSFNWALRLFLLYHADLPPAQTVRDRGSENPTSHLAASRPFITFASSVYQLPAGSIVSRFHLSTTLVLLTPNIVPGVG